MACCGRGKSSKPPANTNRTETPKTLSSPPKTPPPASPPRIASPPRPQPQAPRPAPPVPKSLDKPATKSEAPTDALPKCKYREFKNKQIIGGKEIETYFCKAFSMSVNQAHCRACQKHDK
jgi:hypothetical protein